MIENILEELEKSQTIVFVNFRAAAFDLHEYLLKKEFAVAVIFGEEMKPVERDKIINDFKESKYNVLITTNLLARGFDNRKVGFVINMQIPIYHYDREKADVETYLHRIGRTGRFGERGIALNIVGRDFELKLLDQIKEKYGCEIKEFTKEHLKNLPKILSDVQAQNKNIREKIKETA